MPDLLRQMASERTSRRPSRSLGITQVDSGEASAIIAKLVKEKEHFVREKKMAAIGPLMAPVMASFGVKVDGKTISRAAEEGDREAAQHMIICAGAALPPEALRRTGCWARSSFVEERVELSFSGASFHVDETILQDGLRVSDGRVPVPGTCPVSPSRSFRLPTPVSDLRAFSASMAG